MRTQQIVFVILSWLSPLASLAHADEPEKLPVLPDLAVGSGLTKSFVVEGVCYPDGIKGIAFRVVCDGEKQFSCIYDIADQVPIFLSDGSHTLVYDFGNKRILDYLSSYGNGGCDYDFEKRNFAYNMSIKSKNEENKQEILGPAFRFGNMIKRAGSFKTEVAADGLVTYTSELDQALIIKRNPQNPDSFKLVFAFPEKDGAGMIIDARLINQPIPEELLKFPDLKKFPQKLKVVEYEQKKTGLTEMARYLTEMKYFFGKLALISDDNESLKELLPEEDPVQLRKRDAKFGKVYRKALADQGIVMREYTKPQTAKKPAKSK